jgi:uncharacterized membrane protein
MAESSHSARDTETYARIGWTLLGGLLLAIAVMAIGLLLVAIRGEGNISSVLPLDRELLELSRGTSKAVLGLGILVLFATPVAGVLVALVQFWQERDRAFTLVSAGLVVLLLAAFAIALR